MSKLHTRKLEIISGPIRINNDVLHIEFDCPFDDDLLPNLSDIRVFNLSDNTLRNLKIGQTLTLNGGYEGDVGVLVKGRITSVKTPKIGVDRLTVIQVLDSVPYNAKKKLTKTWAKGVYAETILKDLAKAANLKVAAMKLKKNVKYDKGHSMDGEVIAEIGTVAKECGVSAYISKGNVYIRSLSEGDNHNFRLNKKTGLIGTPEYFEEDVKGKIVKGYRFKSLLQHRMNTASIIHLEAEGISVKLRVRKGAHFGTSYSKDYYTEGEAIFV